MNSMLTSRSSCPLGPPGLTKSWTSTPSSSMSRTRPSASQSSLCGFGYLLPMNRPEAPPAVCRGRASPSTRGTSAPQPPTEPPRLRRKRLGYGRGCRPTARYAYRCRRLCSHFSYRTSFVGLSLKRLDAFNRSFPPHPTLSLEEVYGAITYYLAHTDEVHAYLKRQDELWEAWRAKSATQLSPVIERLRALRA